MQPRYALGVVLCVLCAGAPVLAATKMVEVGPMNNLIFVDQETGSSTTTVNEGDSVEWVWDSSGHSTTSNQSEGGWDSGVQAAPFTFTQQFPVAGRFPYHCIPHQFLGMTGVVVVVPAGGMATTTTTTMPPPAPCDDSALKAVRAEIDGTCGCTGALTHRAYVRCARGVIRGAVRTAMVPATCRDSAKKCAARSTCGRSGAVACCRTTARGVQHCAIKSSALACKAPRGGSACVGDQPSCCDACGGTTCPAPAATPIE